MIHFRHNISGGNVRYPKALFLAALVLAGCEQGNDPADAPFARQAAAVTSHGSTRTPFNSVLANPCQPEDVQFSGSLHTLFVFVGDGAGGGHFKLTTNAQGISGTGTATGARYQSTGSENSVAVLTAGGTITESVTSSFLIVGQGDVPNFRLIVTQHITINANGEPTAVVDHVTTSCQ
jgi:hypothetical protein